MSDPLTPGGTPPGANFIQNPATPPPAPAAPTQPAPAAAVPAATPPATIPLTIDEYQRLRGLEEQLRTFQTQQAAALQEAENKRIKAVADKDGIEKALKEQVTTWEAKVQEERNQRLQFEQAIFAERQERVFAENLTGREFFGETPEHVVIIRKQVANELRSRFETVRDASGQIVTREKATGMPAEHVLPKLLDSLEFAHFFKAKGKGGTLPPQPNPYNPTRSFGAPEPGSLEDIAEQFKRGQGQYPSMGLAPIGPAPAAK